MKNLLYFLFLILLSGLKANADNRAIKKDSADVLNELFKSNLNTNPDSAYWYALQALNYADVYQNKRAKANALNNIGVIYKNRGKIDDALEVYIQSIIIHEELNNKEGLANTLSNIGNLYTIKSDHKKALQYFEEAKVIFNELSNTERLILVMTNIGNSYSKSGLFQKALETYYRADEMSRKLKGFLFPDLYANIGNTYLQIKDFEKSLDYFSKAESIAREINDKKTQANILINKGVIYQELGNLDQALNLQLNALDIAQQINDKTLQMDVFQALATVYFRRNETTTAYFYLDQTTKLKDSLFNIRASQTMAELEALYELNEKERQIQLLRIKDQNNILKIKYNNSILVTIIMSSLTFAALALLIYLRYSQNKQAKRILEKRNAEIISQKQLFEEKNREMTESINYARSVQDTMIESVNLDKHLPESFVLYKPKDIVSGDFFWYTHRSKFDLLAIIDCTGHGVAGAFMTVIANSLLNQVVNTYGILEPAAILDNLNIALRETIHQEDQQTLVHGMDISICRIFHDTKILEFAGAKRPLVYFENNELKEIKGNRLSLGDDILDRDSSFDTHQVKLKEGQVFYMFSDGFSDQFNASGEAKYKIKKFKQFLSSIHQLPMKKQLNKLEKELNSWKGDAEQTDDIIVIGFKYI